MTSDGFVLLKGSKVRTDKQNACRDYIVETRRKFSDKISSDGTTTDDIIFNSPSGAACFVGQNSSFPQNAVFGKKRLCFS